jgi:CelD/BcsL family acetyltransferase involved in cellulose biosynthesis
LNIVATLTQEKISEVQSVKREEPLFRIDPLTDPRWETLLAQHADASVFHSRAWLEALRRTYGYQSFAFTSAAPKEPLRDGLPFCSVENWITGRRLVSVPFSDHCKPLLAQPSDLQNFVAAIQEEALRGRWRYFEIRPGCPVPSDVALCQSSAEYAFHQLDLRPDLATLYANFHKDSIRRKIRRAEREGLKCEAGTTERNLDAFYRLMTITRQRHGVPPQPKKWFRNLIDCFGPALQICVASKNGHAVAAMLTLRYKNTLVYKYGGSDTRFNNLGSVQWLYWEAIQRAKSEGLQQFDLGRCDMDQPGLMRFKRRWGAAESHLTYFRISRSDRPLHVFDSNGPDWKVRASKKVFAHMPSWMLPRVGNLLYKHVG